MSEPVSRRTPLWLILSVVLNMALIGFVAGYLIRDHKGRDRHDRPRVEHSLAKQDRDTVRELMRSVARDARVDRGDRRAAAETLAGVLLAEPYSVEAAQEALVTFRASEQGVRSEADQLLAERIATLTPDQRRIVVDVLSRERGHRRRGRGGRGRR